MFTVGFQTWLYEMATWCVPRCMKKAKGRALIGLVIDQDFADGNTLVYWGVSDKQIFQNWEDTSDLQFLPSRYEGEINA